MGGHKQVSDAEWQASWLRAALRRPIVRLLLVCLSLLIGYVVTYVALSAAGGWRYSQTGRLRYAFGFAASDVIRWQPAWAWWEPFRDVSGHDTSRGNLQGYIFSPLIRLDRRWFHPDREVFGPDLVPR